MKLYKFLKKGAKAPFVDDFVYPVGEWMSPVEGDLKFCENGYHACEQESLFEWMDDELYVCEARGDILKGEDKVVVREIKLVRQVESWNDKNQRLFACDCAEHVLHLFELEFPNDNRPKKAIEIARRFANGMVDIEELDAARAAVWVAARAAAWDAAWVAASATAWAAARAASWVAASATAWAAARAASWATPWDAERKWQMNKLLEYIGDEL